jgi:hypothetical protein
MDLLITLIGNAVVDPLFRKKFLDSPVDVADHYGFQLTKGEFEMMQTVFSHFKPGEKEQLEQAFSVLEERLYLKLKCPRPCHWSIFPPPEFRAELPKVA